MPGEIDWYHYLPPPDAAVRGYFYLTSVGHSQALPGEPYPKQMHPKLYHFSWEEGRVLPEFQLLLITQGRGTFQSRNSPVVSLSAGQALILPPNLWHRYRPASETGWTEKWVQFDGAIAFRLFAREVETSRASIVTLQDPETTEQLLCRLEDAVQRTPNFNSALLSMRALAVLESVLAAPSAQSVLEEEKKANDAVVAAAVNYIWTRGRHVLNVPEVADAIGVNRRTLERHMLMTLGHGVLDEIVNCRFVRAERLVRSTNLPLKLIVSLSGFGSLENMRQIFLAKTGMSPGSYRSHHRGLFGGTVSAKTA